MFHWRHLLAVCCIGHWCMVNLNPSKLWRTALLVGIICLADPGEKELASDDIISCFLLKAKFI